MASRSKVRLRGVWAVVLLAAAGAAFWMRSRGPLVETVVVARKDLVRTVVASGRVMAPAEIKMGSLVSGTVATVLAREGQKVEQGELLATLDDAAAKAHERQAVAALAEAKAGRASVGTFDAPAAEQQLVQAKARLERERTENERTQRLLDKKVIAPAEAELVATNLRLAESQALAAQLQLRAVAAGGSASQRAAALTAAAEAQLESARVELSRTKLRAPASGIVLQRFVEPGDLVNPGTLMFTLSTQGETRVVIEPDERSLALVEVGQTARVSTEAFPEDTFEATLRYIAPSVNPRRGTIEVRLHVPNPPAYLRPDMTVSTEILVGEEKQAVVLPAYTIQSRLLDPSVFVVTQGRLEKRAVRLGASDAENVQVLDGVQPGEVIVSRVTSELEPGKRVRIKGETAR